MHAFQQTSSAPLRAVIGRTGSGGGRLELVDVGWIIDPSAGGPIGGPLPGGERRVDQPVRLEAPIFITNAFALEATLISQNRRRSQFDLGVVRRRNQTGYRVAISRNRTQLLELIRTDRRGDLVIGRAERIGNLNDGRPHSILLTRDANGAMTVAVDGAAWINVVDPDSGAPFNAVSMTDILGEFIVTSVTAYGI